jgi:hypothetical protein
MRDDDECYRDYVGHEAGVSFLQGVHSAICRLGEL